MISVRWTEEMTMIVTLSGFSGHHLQRSTVPSWSTNFHGNEKQQFHSECSYRQTLISCIGVFLLARYEEIRVRKQRTENDHWSYEATAWNRGSDARWRLQTPAGIRGEILRATRDQVRDRTLSPCAEELFQSDDCRHKSEDFLKLDWRKRMSTWSVNWTIELNSMRTRKPLFCSTINDDSTKFNAIARANWTTCEHYNGGSSRESSVSSRFHLDLCRQTVDHLRREHEQTIQRLKQLKQEEISTALDVTTHTRSVGDEREQSPFFIVVSLLERSNRSSVIWSRMSRTSTNFDWNWKPNIVQR